MNKVKIFHSIRDGYKGRKDIEDDINAFGNSHEIISTSICCEECGYDVCYTAIVLYKE